MHGCNQVFFFNLLPSLLETFFIRWRKVRFCGAYSLSSLYYSQKGFCHLVPVLEVVWVHDELGLGTDPLKNQFLAWSVLVHLLSKPVGGSKPEVFVHSSLAPLLPFAAQLSAGWELVLLHVRSCELGEGWERQSEGSVPSPLGSPGLSYWGSWPLFGSVTHRLRLKANCWIHHCLLFSMCFPKVESSFPNI